MFTRIRTGGALLASAAVLASIPASPAAASLPRPQPPGKPAVAASIPTPPTPDGGQPWFWIVGLLVVGLVVVVAAAASVLASRRRRTSATASRPEDVADSAEDVLVGTSRGGARGR